MQSINGSIRPSKASRERAAMRSAFFERRKALSIANTPLALINWVPLINASPSLLYKKIKALTGQSPIDFIKKIRLDHSLELLQSRKYSITEVSEQCGFSSVGYFSTVFKKHFDKTPSEIIS